MNSTFGATREENKRLRIIPGMLGYHTRTRGLAERSSSLTMGVERVASSGGRTRIQRRAIFRQVARRGLGVARPAVAGHEVQVLPDSAIINGLACGKLCKTWVWLTAHMI
jgi:hypothetical protein